MRKFFRDQVKRNVFIPLLFLLLTIVSILVLPFVNVNYDMADYLPADAGTKQAIEVSKEEFNYPGTAEVMAKNISILEASQLKQKILEIDGVRSVIWLDTFIDVKTPIVQISTELLKKYYIDNTALFSIEFVEDNYSTLTSDALGKIKEIDGALIVAGNAENAGHMKNVLSTQIISIIAYVLPICLLILLLASHSWLEPLLYMIVIGTSIAINMGTNAIFGSISFITSSMASVLQLAICMDYSIFLMHRYFEERDLGNDVPTAVRKASFKSITSISASALTTIAGFLALVFMRYKIGMDVGLVLAKGILISFLTVIILMPVLISIFSKALDKTRHRFFLPSFGRLSKLTFKARYFIIVLIVLIIIPVFLAQDNNDFFYGDNSITTGEGKAYDNRKEIIDKFGITNNILILVPKGNIPLESALVKDLSDMKYTKEVVSLVTSVDPSIPVSFLPTAVIQNFNSANYTRMILYLNVLGETKEVFDSVKTMRDILQSHYPNEWYAAGVSTSLTDIKDTVELDGRIVTIISLFAVGLVILIIFKSISIPLILLFVIQASVWINMSIPYFSDFKMAFIGYLVISSLQLGATIDYGILLTNRYLEYRNIQEPSQASRSALKSSGFSVIVSAMILATAGFGFGLVSQVGSISELGILIGRGAVISCTMTLFLLPAMLTAFDKIIFKTTLKGKEKYEKQI